MLAITLKKMALGTLSAAALIAATLAATPALAQSGTDIPIIVMGEDSDPMSVKRSNDIFRRVISSIQEQMSRYSFYVIDEDILAVRAGWVMKDRRPKTELLEIATLAGTLDDPSLHPRAMVMFKIRAAAANKGFGTVAQVRVTGDIYDVVANRFIGSWEAPRMEFGAPANCNQFCIEEVVGDKARDVAAQVGDVLRKKLAYLTQGQGGATAGGSDGACTGLSTTYQVEFRNFTTREALELTEVMENEFPCYVSARSPNGDTTKFIYGYVTQASGSKMNKWMNILLINSGYDPDSQVKVIMSGTKLVVDKIFDTRPAANSGSSYN